jgi:hypothetical protein
MAAETIFFFNPFVSRLCKNIRLEREKNCDIHVVSFKYSPALYAETLLQAERLKQLVPDFQLAAVNRKKHLLQRIQYFTSEKIINQGLRFNIVAPLIGLVLLLLLSTSVLFQSGKTALPTQSSSDIHHLPFSNYIISDTEFDKDFLPESLTTEPLTEQKSLKQPVIENKIIVKPEPAAKPQQQIIEEILKPVDINFALPVATRENDAARQIIIQEEGSGSASLKVYYLSFENGSWILQPEWVITAKEVILDSVSRNYDSSLKNKLRRIYPDQQ